MEFNLIRPNFERHVQMHTGICIGLNICMESHQAEKLHNLHFFLIIRHDFTLLFTYSHPNCTLDDFASTGPTVIN